MRRYISKKNLVEYLVAIFLILDGNSIYHSVVGVNYHFPLICMILGILLVVSVSGKTIYLHHNEKSIFLLLGLYYGLYFVLRLSRVLMESYVSMFLIGLPIFLYYFLFEFYKGNENDLFYKIENIILVIAVLSSIVWFLGCVFHVIETNCSATIYWGSVTKVNGFFGVSYVVHTDKTFGTGLMRNGGIFTEAPMYSLWLYFALSIEFFLKKKSSLKRIIILIIADLTTISTTGFIFIVMSIMLKLFYLQMGKSSRKKLIGMVCLGVVIIIALQFLMDVLSLKSQTGSYATRVSDYEMGFNLWKKYPILGSGYGNYSELATINSKGATGFSNSIMAILGTGGLWHFIIYIVAIIVTGAVCLKNHLNYTCFFVCYLYLTITTIFFARYIYAVILAYGLMRLITSRYDGLSVN